MSNTVPRTLLLVMNNRVRGTVLLAIRVTGGTARDQARLLRAEGVEVKRGRVDLGRFGWEPE